MTTTFPSAPDVEMVQTNTLQSVEQLEGHQVAVIRSVMRFRIPSPTVMPVPQMPGGGLTISSLDMTTDMTAHHVVDTGQRGDSSGTMMTTMAMDMAGMMPPEQMPEGQSMSMSMNSSIETDVTYGRPMP